MPGDEFQPASPVLNIPLGSETVPAGFPSPAQDHVEQCLDLNEYLIANPAATFFLTVGSDSMKDIGIIAGHKIIVDRSQVATHRRIVVASINGLFTVKRLIIEPDGTKWLKAENPAYPDIHFKAGDQVEIWGVVTGWFRKSP